jgi:hypothetical protein
LTSNSAVIPFSDCSRTFDILTELCWWP